MKLLKTHGRFLVVLVVLMVLLLVGNRELQNQSGRIQTAESSARSLLATNYRMLFQDAARFDGQPATMEGLRIQDRTRNAAHIGEARNRIMTFVTAPEYTPNAAGSDADVDALLVYYRAKEAELRRELSFRRYFAVDARAPDALGFESPRGEDGSYTVDNIAAWLRRLDLVRTAAGSIERAGAQRLTKLEFRQVSEPLSARGVPTRPVVPDEPPFMEAEGLRLHVQATEEALYNLLIDLQRPMKGELRGRYLAVESFRFEKPDLYRPVTNLITAEITIVAYRVNEESSYPVDREASEHQQRTSIGPRTFR